MPFGTLTAPSGELFVPRAVGIYQSSTRTYLDPAREIRFKPGTYNKNSGLYTASVTFLDEERLADNTIVRFVESLQFSIPKGGTLFTPARVDDNIAIVSHIVTPDLLNRLLNGES